jgi:hypothetical protein
MDAGRADRPGTGRRTGRGRQRVKGTAAAGVVGGLALSAAAVWWGARLPVGTPGWVIPGAVGAA